MAAAAVTDRTLPPESIPTVDLRLLSQSELYTLSLCSSSAFNPHPQNDVVIPKIDRTVFNESAGSRKQTYSRLRLAPASSSYASICRRTPHLRIPKPTSIETDPERAENSKIVSMLKALFSKQANRNGVTLASIEHTSHIPSLPSLPSLPNLPNLPNQAVTVANSSDLMSVDAVNSSNSIGFGAGVADMTNSMNMSNSMGLSNLMSGGLKRKRGRPRKDKDVVPVIREIFKYEKREDGVGNYMVDSVNGIKRKRGRGRPRKDESMPMPMSISMVMPTSTAMVVVPEEKNEENENENDKDVVVNENSVESDKEVLNSKGLVVDVVALAELEDPFGPEIRRRTEGMSTDAELLGFLEGLGGRWGSRRRKRKVIDASLFGDYLPKGWSLSISLKRKEKQVWLFCRRYISPGGRQFISCKEISSYLLSISGLQDNKQLDYSHEACKMDTQNPAGLAVLGNNTKDDSQSGNHLINEVAGAKESTLEHVQDNVGSSSVGEIPKEDHFAAKNINPEIFDTNGNKKLDSGIDNSNPEASLRVEISSDKRNYDQQHEAYGNPDMQAGKIVLDRVETSDKQDKDCPLSSYKVDNIAALAEKRSFGSNSCLASEAALTSNGNDGIIELSDRRNAVQCVSDAIKTCSVEQENGLQICAPPLIDDQTSVRLPSDVIGDSAAAEKSVREVVVGNPFYTENMSSTSTANDLKLDSGKFATVESIFGSNNNHDAANKHCGNAVKQDFIVEGTAVFQSRNEHFSSIDNVKYGSLNSGLAKSEQKICSDSSVLALSGDEEICIDNNVKNVSTFSVTSGHNMVLNCGSNERSSYAGPGTDVVDVLQDERKYGNFSLSPLSRRNQATVEVEPRQRVSLSSLLSLSGQEKACSAENLADLLPGRHADTAEFNEVETSRNAEVIFSSDRTYNDVGASMTSNKERSLELSSLLSSGKGATFGSEGNVTDVDNRSVEECRQQFSGSGLLAGSCFVEHPSNVYTVDQIYDRPVNELKFDNGQNPGNHDLALDFGDPHAGLFADTTGLEHEKYATNCSAIPTRIEQNIGSQINVNRVNDNFVEEQGISSFSDLFSLSCNGKLWGSEPNFNHAYNRRWEVPDVNEVGTSKNKKYMVDFGADNAQPVENVMPGGGIWRAGEDAFQTSMADLSNPPAQSPASFCTFDILSDKAEDGLYRLGDKYDRGSCFEELGSGRTEPVEFSFLTAPNSTSFQGVPDKNPYGAGMEQPYGSSYWIGKHDLVQNIPSGSQVTTLCVWCRNEFHHEPVHPGTQAAIGSMCPTCRTRISEQVNAL